MQVLRNAGEGGVCVRLPGGYEGVRFNIIMVTGEWVGMKYPGKKGLYTRAFTDIFGTGYPVPVTSGIRVPENRKISTKVANPDKANSISKPLAKARFDNSV